AIASFIFGGLWYGVLSKQWMAAANLDETKLKPGGGASLRPFIITFIAQLFMAWILAGLMLHFQKAGLPATMKNGVITALFIWAGFVMTSLIVNHQFQMQKRTLTLIDGGHWLGVYAIQGAILGRWALQ
ncbi:MAG: DUF1761 domain-containing protein, partial [Hyphomicrobiaceae bacterium]